MMNESLRNGTHASPRGISRRGFVASTVASTLLPALARAEETPIRVAAVLTCFTYRSHAHVILENFLEDYLFNGVRTKSGCKVVSMYVDQFPEGEMSRAVSKEYGIPIFGSIDEALTLGGDQLEADGVLSIGEHGEYPHNEKGQHQYPRKQFFDQIVATFRRTGRTAPVFNDKHLSYRWDWAREMYDTSREMGFPLMAGSSVPLAQRRPPLELPTGAPITTAVSIHGGGVESYDFHALEVLQSIWEARAGGEVGVADVTFLEGDSLWKASEEGLWSIELADAAMRAELGPETPTLRELLATEPFRSSTPHGILITYRDGKKAIALKVGDSGTRWNFACQVEGEKTPRATSFYVGPWQNRNLFRALSHAIQIHFREKRAPYPVERTLLTTGILAAEMDSRAEGGRTVSTPELEIVYAPRDFRRCREMGESWRLIPEGTPEPEGIHRYFNA